MTPDAAHTRWWQIFEVVFGIPFLAALGLHWIMPLTLPGGKLTIAITTGGVVCIIVGVTLVIFARREFARRGQPTDPGRPTGTLVTTGVFSVSRNPLYLGGASVMVGLALVLNLPWLL